MLTRQVRFLDMPLVRATQSSAKTILAHFHYCLKGQQPFRKEFDWTSAKTRRMARLDAEQSNFMAAYRDRVSRKGEPSLSTFVLGLLLTKQRPSLQMSTIVTTTRLNTTLRASFLMPTGYQERLWNTRPWWRGRRQTTRTSLEADPNFRQTGSAAWVKTRMGYARMA